MNIKVTSEMFCSVWNKAAKNGQTLDDVAKILKISKPLVYNKRHNLTKLGLKFPKLARLNNQPVIDIKKLQRILDSK